MFTPRDITPGEMWACRYETEIMMGLDGSPAENLKPGDAARGPETVTGIGVIVTRDLERELLEVIDTETEKRHVVRFQDVWDIDRAEIIKEDHPATE